MDTVCPKCGANWSPDLAPDVETVVVEEATGEALLVVGPEHACGRIVEWG